MLREHCKIGMKVIFGRHKGEKTIGEVVKIGTKRAKVKTIEARGAFRRKGSGRQWSVPFGIMVHLDERLEEALLSLPSKDDDEDVKRYLVEGSRPMPYFKHSLNNSVLLAIFLAYKERKNGFPRNRRLKNLFLALGRPVSQRVSNAWHSEKIAKEQKELVGDICSQFKEVSDRVQAWSVLGSLLNGNSEISVKRLGGLLKDNNSLSVRGVGFKEGEELTGHILASGPEGRVVALPNGEVGHLQNDAKMEPCGETKMVEDFLASECQAHGIKTSPILARRSMQDFKMWKSGITENHWTALVRNGVENWAAIQRLEKSN